MRFFTSDTHNWHVASVAEEDEINAAQAEWYWENKDNLHAIW